MQPNQLMIEDATLIWRNFEGAEKQYNNAGDRNFHVLLTEPQAADVLKAGLPVKETIRTDEDGVEHRMLTLRVAVGYQFRPPLVTLITSASRTPLTEETIKVLDMVDISHCDLIVAVAKWEVAGKSGNKAWLRKMFVTQNEDELDLKYSQN